MLLPNDHLKELQDAGNFTQLMVDQEAARILPFGFVWDYYNEVCGSPAEGWFDEIRKYEADVQSKR